MLMGVRNNCSPVSVLCTWMKRSLLMSEATNEKASEGCLRGENEVSEFVEEEAEMGRAEVKGEEAAQPREAEVARGPLGLLAPVPIRPVVVVVAVGMLEVDDRFVAAAVEPTGTETERGRGGGTMSVVVEAEAMLIGEEEAEVGEEEETIDGLVEGTVVMVAVMRTAAARAAAVCALSVLWLLLMPHTPYPQGCGGEPDPEQREACPEGGEPLTGVMIVESVCLEGEADIEPADE